MRATHLIAKLESFVRLSFSERELLDALTRNTCRVLAPRQDLAREHDRPRYVNVVLDGWACRYIDLADGRRQIIDFLLPGDCCDAGIAHLEHLDYSIGAISDVTVAEIAFADFDLCRKSSERLDLALKWNTLVELAVSRQWIVNIGQRSAAERIAHLFCEMHLRLTAAGVASDQSYYFPPTQEQIGQATGLSSVHVNRSLQQLRADQLIVLRDRTLTILNLEGLRDLAMFDPGYLHLDHEGRAFDAKD